MIVSCVQCETGCVGVGGQGWPVLDIANNQDSQETVTALETIISHIRICLNLSTDNKMVIRTKVRTHIGK